MLNICSFFIIWSLVYRQVLATDSRVDYVALIDPCRDEDRLCPVACKISKLTGTYNCNFCYCNDPKDKLNWETTPTTTTQAPTTTHAPSVAPGHTLVGGIEYVELKNACEPIMSMCPVKCLLANVTRYGRVCETCDCPENIRDASMFGKRDTEMNIGSERETVVQKRLLKRCMPMPFACPIYHCPTGKKFAIGPNGCRECHCIDDTQPTVKAANVIPTAPTNIDFKKHFFNTYCVPDPSYCPSDCNVVVYRVGDWRCFHCSCTSGQMYVALGNPCQTEGQSNVCSSGCRIRYLDDPKDPSVQCDYCDCSQTGNGNGAGIVI